MQKLFKPITVPMLRWPPDTLPSGRRRRRLCCRGFTLVEVMIVIGLIALLSAVSTTVFGNYLDKARNIQAISEIRTMQNEIVVYEIDNDTLPDTLGEVGLGNALDPWKTPYDYLRIADQGKKGGKKRRKRDGKDSWLNTDFDLYSKGKDKKSKQKLKDKKSKDDIVRADDGKYVGVALKY